MAITAKDLTATVRVERRGRLLDFWIDGHFSSTRDITDFYDLSEEDVKLAVAMLDEYDRQKAQYTIEIRVKEHDNIVQSFSANSQCPSWHMRPDRQRNGD